MRRVNHTFNNVVWKSSQKMEFIGDWTIIDAWVVSYLTWELLKFRDLLEVLVNAFEISQHSFVPRMRPLMIPNIGYNTIKL